MTFLGRPTKHPRADIASGRLLVVEQGAGGFDTVATPDGSEETTVVAEGPGDSILELPFRVTRRLALLERNGHSVSRAVLLAADRHDKQSVASRGLVARALIAHMTAAGGGELVLAGDGTNVELRIELLALVEDLVFECEETPVTIRLQLRAEGARLAGTSGIHPTDKKSSSDP